MQRRSHHIKKQTQRGHSCKQTPEYLSEEAFLKGLETADCEMSSEKALHSVHKFVHSNRIKNWARFQSKVDQLLRVCKKCDKWNQLKGMLTCSRCEDHYHRTCLRGQGLQNQDKFVCSTCLMVPATVTPCAVCKESIEDDEDSAICECSGCEYHLSCGSKIKNVCRRCWQWRQKIKTKALKKKIHKQQTYQSKVRESNRNLRQMFALLRSKKDSLVGKHGNRFQRKGCQFKALTLLDGNNKAIARYKRELTSVIQERGMNYTEDLMNIQFYVDTMGNTMELGLCNMSQEEEIQYRKYKDQPIGPYLFQYSKEKGYGVIADKDIRKGTIICQYVGDVVTLRRCAELDIIQGSNDSKMDLWVGRHSDEKLIIRPSKWTNIARFLNGVKTQKSSKNVESIKVCYRGLPVVLLLARRDIKKGQSLVYYYNAGGIEAKYDTSHFK